MRQDKKESILNTAKQMFDRYGVQKTNLDEMARRARVAKATIYNYFGSKDQVYIEVLKREANEIVEKVSKAIEQARSPMEKLRAFIYTRFRQVREAVNVFSVYREWSVPISSKVKNVRDHFFEREMNILQVILEEGVREGVFYVDNVFLTVRSIGRVINGLELSLVLEQGDRDMDKELDGLFNILCRGILIKKEGKEYAR
jgi:AcrR family transcriptional regulator